MDKRVDPGRSGLEDIHGRQRFALRREGDLDRIVHAAAADDFDLAAIGSAAEDAGRLALEDAAVRPNDLVAMPAVGPVEPTVRSQEGTVNVGRVADEAEFRDQLPPLVGFALAGRILQPPEAR